MSVKPIPEGYTTITPYLIVEDADKLVEFVETIFGGELVFKMKNEAGRISHGEMKVGNAMFMLSEASGEWKPTQTMLHLYVDDVDFTATGRAACGIRSEISGGSRRISKTCPRKK
jgi:PhnB protein